MDSYILNDEREANVYGFRVKNDGIDLERFKKNPVILAMHRDWDLMAVIGRWTNIRIEGSLLLADPVFDEEDEDAKRIAGKVKRGFIKAVSMGFLWMKEHMEKAVDGIFDLAKSELYEGSFVTIPGNKNSVRLYAAPNKLMKEEEIKMKLSAVMSEASPSPETNTDTKSKSNMEKFTLNGPALTALTGVGLNNQEDPNAVNSAIAQLGTELSKKDDALTEAKKTIQNMKDAQLSQLKAQANSLVDGAIEAGKLTADQKEKYVKLAINDMELATSIIGSIPGKQSLGAGGAKTPRPGDGDPKTMDEFEKLPLAEQLAFKNDNPKGYQALFQ